MKHLEESVPCIPERALSEPACLRWAVKCTGVGFGSGVAT